VGGRDDLAKALEAIVTRARSEAGEVPTADELLAYDEGELDAAERARIAAKLEEFPEAALALENLRDFPVVQPGPGVTAPTAEETDAAWQAFRRRMGYGEQVEALAAEGEVPVEEEVRGRRGTSRQPWWTWRPLGWAAAVVLLAVGLATGWLLGRLHPPPTGNRVVAQLTPEGADPARAGAAENEMRLREGAGGVVLVLLGADVAAEGSYRVRVEGPDGEVVWASPSLEADATGALWLHVPVGYLPAGEYRLVVAGAAEGGEVAAYSLRVRAVAER
jgi:hypothetical protein